MKYILGAGLVGLLARDILGSDWKIIPYGKSRFYAFNPPLCDNYVIKDSTIDDYMNQYAFIPLYIRNSFSIAGHLTQNHHIALDAWLEKVYGPTPPNHVEGYWKAHLEYFSYGDCLEIYRRLQERYVTEIVDNQEKIGKLAVKINERRIITDIGIEKEYDQILSTIPLPILTETMGLKYEFPASNMWCYHVQTEWDMEGASHILIADPHIDIYKVTKVNDQNYVFYSSKQIVQAGRFFMSILNKKHRLVGEIQFENGIPCGPIPDLPELSAARISTLGSRAMWDDCMDIGSCIKRLLRGTYLTYAA